MNITLNKDDIEFLNKVIHESRYSECLKAKCILDKINNKEIHEGDRVKVVKVEDSYKKLLGKTGMVVNTGYFITVNIGGIRYYIEKEEIEVI